jgi:osmotically-inducible protein OsmY
MKQWNSLKILFFAASMIFTLNASAVDAPITDAVIIAKIESKIALDPSLSIFKISISSDNGIVKLSGHVNSDSDAAAAVQIAQSTDGVTDVDGSG